MSNYIIIRGAPGTGKSSVAKELSKKGYKVIHFDRVMAGFNLGYKEGEKWIPLANFLEADKRMMPKFKKWLEEGIPLIFDWNFYHKEHIEDLVKNLDYPHKIITLKASLDVCNSRDKDRKGEIGEQATKEVFELVNKFDYGVVIDTEGKTVEEVADEIYQKLAEY